MIKGAKRQIVSCPICHELKITLGVSFFRCCGTVHPIEDNLLKKPLESPQDQPDKFEVMI